MRKLFYLSILLAATLVAKAQGVHFENLTLQEALAKAASENKLVFLDCYTSWCAPCKEMSNQEFPKKEAGDYFNPRFVNIKLDIEKGEGIEIAKKYQIKTVPTFLLLQPDGTVCHTIIGSAPIQTFIDKFRAYFGEETYLAQLDREYAEGNMDNIRLLEYAGALSAAKRRKDAGRVCDELYRRLSEKEKISAVYWQLMSCQIAYRDYDEKFAFILKHREEFNETVGKETIDAFLYTHYNTVLMPCLFGNAAEKSWQQVDSMRQELAILAFEGKGILELKYQIAQAKKDKDVEGIIRLMGELPGRLEEKDLFMYMSVPEFILDMATKEQIAEMVAWEDKYMEATLDERRFYMDRLFAPYRRMATVGVCWEAETSLDTLMLKAKIENRPIFLNCCTGEAKTCKWMDKHVFRQEEVGDFFNRHFIAAKWDVESESRLKALASFDVEEVPTFLLLGGYGEILYRATGKQDARHLMEIFEKGLEDYNAFVELKRRYERGEREKDFLKEYVKLLYEIHSLDRSKTAKELFPLLTDEERKMPAYQCVEE